MVGGGQIVNGPMKRMCGCRDCLCRRQRYPALAPTAMIKTVLFLLSLLLPVPEKAAWAQETGAFAPRDTPAFTGAERSFGEPRHWLNMRPDTRLPIRERRLRESALTAPTPPRTTRSGFELRLGVTGENRENVFRTEEDTQSDQILTFTPGVEYQYTADRWWLYANYGFDAALYRDNTDLTEAISAQSGALVGNYAFTPQTSLTVLEGYDESRDAGDADIPGSLPAFSTTRVNTVLADVESQFAPDLRANLRYRNQYQTSDADDTSAIFENSGQGSVTYAFSPVDRISAVYGASHYGYADTDDQWAQEGSLEYEREFGDRFSLRAHVGAVATPADGGRVFPKAGGAVSASWTNVLVTIEAERELIAAIGVDDLVFSTRIGGSLVMRLGRGLQFEGGVEHQNLTVLDGLDTEVQSISADAKLSYAIDDHLWLWGQYRHGRETTETTRVIDNRILFGVVRSFAF